MRLSQSLTKRIMVPLPLISLTLLFINIFQTNFLTEGLSIHPPSSPLIASKKYGVQLSSSISVVTGASGFVGRHVVYSLISRHLTLTKSLESKETSNIDIILCLVRCNRVPYEQSYWDAHLKDMQLLVTDNDQHSAFNSVKVKVMPYDMLDNGSSLYDALEYGFCQYSTTLPSHCCCTVNAICVYHIASTFGPTPDPTQTAKDNVQSAENVVHSLRRFYNYRFLPDDDNPNNGVPIPNLRLVLTSSMAAVRGTNQVPLNDEYYTYKDWNTVSKLDDLNWGSCYQWSKAESERKVLELVRQWNESINRNSNTRGQRNGQLEMIALCPSFVFGPSPPLPQSLESNSLTDSSSTSYSIELVKQWIYGLSKVQSRLCVDVRDVALAHVAAGTVDFNDNIPSHSAASYSRRYLVSTEVRLRSESVAEALQKTVLKVCSKYEKRSYGVTADSLDVNKIVFDTTFDGGAIKIGQREVEAEDKLRTDLGVVCRSIETTIEEMAEMILLQDFFINNVH